MWLLGVKREVGLAGRRTGSSGEGTGGEGLVGSQVRRDDDGWGRLGS